MARLVPLAFSAALFGALLLLGFFAAAGVGARGATAAQVTLRLWPAGQGRIDVSQQGSPDAHCDFLQILQNTVPCDVSVASDKPVTLKAVPEPGAVIPADLQPDVPDFPVAQPAFVRWSRAGCEGTTSCTFTPDTDGDWITAVFTPLQLQVGINGPGTVGVQRPGGVDALACAPAPETGGFGQVTCHGLFAADEEVALVATPQFLGDQNLWAPVCAEGSNDVGPTCTITMSNIRTFAGVAFGRPPPPLEPPGFPFQITARVRVERSGSGQGLVSGSGFDCGAQCTVDIDYQARVTLKADAKQGSTFVRWGGVCATNPTCVFSAGSSTFVLARFDAVQTTTATTTTATTQTTTTTATTTATTATTATSTTTSTVTDTVRRKLVFTTALGKVSTQGHGARRTLVIVMVVDRPARLKAQVLRQGRTLVTRNYALAKGRNSLRLRLPQRAKQGTYRLVLKVTAGSSVRTMTKLVKVPR